MATFVSLTAITTAANATVIKPMSTFTGTFSTGITPWSAAGGGAQCANYGTPSINGRLRGDLTFASVAGIMAGQLSLPADPNPSVYPLEVCDLNDGLHPTIVPADSDYGLAVYIPTNFSIPNRSGYVNIGEYHFQNVGGQPPICLLLRSDSVQLSVLGGAYSPTSGFQYSAGKHNIPPLFAVPKGALTYGAWNELTFHIHWATDTTGNAQFYYRAQGQTAWQPGASWSGIPTMTWNAGSSVGPTYSDNVMNYGTAMSVPFSLSLADDLIGTSLAGIQTAMP